MSKINQTKINFIWNIVCLISNIVVGLLYTPFLVKNLGVVAYGVIPLALIINQYVSVITGSLTGALTRFYTVSFQKGDFEKSSQYLSTSLAVIAGIIGILSLFAIYFVNSLDVFFKIPQDLISDVSVLFTCTLLSFAVSLISSVLNVILYAVNRLDYLSIIKSSRVCLKFIFAIMFFYLFSAKINYLGYAILLGELVVLFISIVLFIKIKPINIHISIRSVNKALLAGVIAMSSWTVVHQIGDVGIYRIDNLLVNNFYGLKMSGILGAISELGTYTMVVVGVIGSLFGPLILIAYSKDNHDSVKDLTLKSSFYVGLLTSVIVGVVIGLSKPLLTIWLGDEFTPYSEFLLIKMSVIPFYAAAGIFAFVSRAWNRVKVPAIVTVIIGCINFCTCYLICKYGIGGENTITIMLLVSAGMTVIQSFVLNSFIYSQIYKGESKKIVRIFISLTCAMVLSYYISNMYNSYLSIGSIPQLIFGVMIVGVISLSVVFFVLTNKSEKKNLLIIIKSTK